MLKDRHKILNSLKSEKMWSFSAPNEHLIHGRGIKKISNVDENSKAASTQTVVYIIMSLYSQLLLQTVQTECVENPG